MLIEQLRLHLKSRLRNFEHLFFFLRLILVTSSLWQVDTLENKMLRVEMLSLLHQRVITSSHVFFLTLTYKAGPLFCIPSTKHGARTTQSAW